MIENKNQPVHPCQLEELGIEGMVKIRYSGLTKIEEFAKAAMQGILSGDYPGKDIHNNMQLPEIKLVAEQSVAYADELLKQLDSNS